jgi:uncharacterized protein
MVEMMSATTDSTARAGSAQLEGRASPWILGLYGLAGATFMGFAHVAGWFGDPQSARLLIPVTAVLGGLVPLLAAMWAYAALDGLATAMLGTWGAFWIGVGLTALFAPGNPLERPAASPELAYWFIPLAAITWMGAVAATRVSRALVSVLVLLAGASTLAAIGEGLGAHGLTLLGAWVFIAAAICAWYTATAMMIDDSFDRDVLPLGSVRTTPRDHAVGPRDVLPQAAAARRAG